jgi:uncharacterized protein (DUF58 family)
VRRAAGTALGGAVLLLAALAFDASVLFVPALALIVVSGLAPPWIWLASRGASVTRRFEQDRVVEDQPLEVRIEVRGGPLGLPGVEILDPFVGEVVALSSWRGARVGNGTTDVRIIARFPRRGRRRLEPPRLILRDPLGLARLVHRSASPAQTVLVLPRTEPVRWLGPETGQHLDRPAGPAALDALAATEVDGLRPYRRGTPASRICWPALARGAGLLERRLQTETGSSPLVALDLRCTGPEELIDAAVRAAASLTLALARRGGCDLRLPGDRRSVHIDPDLCAWPATHVRLALIEGGPDAVPPLLAPDTRNGTIFYVSAQRDRVPQTVLQAGRAAVLVLPAQLAPASGQPVSFEVTGCRGYLLAVGARRAASRERAA